MKFTISFDVDTRLKSSLIEKEIQEQLTHVMIEVRGHHVGGLLYTEDNKECGDWGFENVSKKP